MQTIVALIARIQLALIGARLPTLSARTPQVRASLAKGPTFIEYAILAAIAVALGLLMYAFLGGNNGFFSSLFSKIGSSF